jgi:hypothetical protein
VFKFHSIWSIITQESNLGKNDRFCEKIAFSRDLLSDNVWPHRTMSDVTQTRSGLQFCALETLSQTMSGSTGQCLTETFSPTFIHDFGHILLTGCPIDLILFLMHL